MQLRLGDMARDSITGFEGVLIAKTEWLTGCVRFGVQSQTLKDGIPTEAQWFDESQLLLVKAKVAEAAARDIPPGGPMPTPGRRSDPRV